ncbi:hypothetical protein IEO21_02986 [Rhodonia placenta]|uniref:Uncharacterized protein n=1 Tax=Rhodonia placenta TaxID=104341 RepID=A0A8H7P6L5_9APHY|nr:hypothetical protein IEO21_02986 [Postia placenta]
MNPQQAWNEWDETHRYQTQQDTQPRPGYAPTQYYQPAAEIQLQERSTNSFRFDNITPAHFRQDQQPQLLVESVRDSAAGAGPVRTARRSAQAYGTHPYQRPQSAAPLRTGTAARLSPVHERCPAANVWRERLLLSTLPGAEAPSLSFDRPGTSTASTPTVTPTHHAQGLPAAPVSAHANMPRYNIRADVHFDAARGLLIAMLELPGVRKTDVRISLAQCPHSRMKVLAVAGVAFPSHFISDSAHGGALHAVRERKCGAFGRCLPVPPETKSARLATALIYKYNAFALKNPLKSLSHLLSTRNKMYHIPSRPSSPRR